MPAEAARPPVSPILVIAVGLLAVSTASIFIRYAQAEADSIVIAAYRLGLATLILTPYAILKHGAELRALGRRDLLLGIGSGVFLAVHFATWITSLAYTSVASSVVLVQTAPLWVALAAPIFLKEAVRPRVVWGLALALVGGIAVSLADSCSVVRWSVSCGEDLLGGRAMLGNFLALAGAWAAAGYLVIGRSLRARLSLVAYIYLVYGIAAVVLTALMFTAGRSPVGYAPQTYLWMLLLALIPQLLGHSSFNWALGYLPASFVSITLLGEPIGTAILAAILLDEIPSVVKLMGAALILIGIYLASKPLKNRSKKGEP